MLECDTTKVKSVASKHSCGPCAQVADLRAQLTAAKEANKKSRRILLGLRRRQRHLAQDAEQHQQHAQEVKVRWRGLALCGAPSCCRTSP